MEARGLDWAASVSPLVREHLSRHPRVAEVAATDAPLVFRRADWTRRVTVGLPAPVGGLVEIADNNPWVCADAVNVPTPAVHAALVGLAPLAWANLIVDEPVVQISRALDAAELEQELAIIGYSGPVITDVREGDLGPVIAATCLVPVATPDDPRDLDGAFEERYGRAFFVRRDESSTWATSLVAGLPYAAYRLRYTPGDDHSLLTVQVLADEHGKVGELGLIHAMNVMAGFEESLGIADGTTRADG